MKLYNSVGPNPHMVRMFMAEKGIELELHDVDIRGGENRREAYLNNVNSRGQCPVLELDDGRHIAEITVICEYLEEKFPATPLIGASAEQRAETRMWVRRLDLSICEPLANGFRASEGYEMFKDRFRVLPEAADGLKAIAQDNLRWLDGDMNGRDTIAESGFSMADIHLFAFLNFGSRVGQPVNADFKNLSAWFERMAARPSASA